MKRTGCLFMVMLLVISMAAGCTSQPTETKSVNTNTASKEVNSALYKGEDRSAKLESGAKTEGKLLIYEGMNQADLDALVKGFNKKYPYIKVEMYRTDSDDVLQRVMTEEKAGKMFADIIGLSEIPADILVKQGLMQPYYSPEAANIGADKKDSNGLWTMYRQQFYVLGYNTDLVKAPPKTYEEVLEWEGKIGIEMNSAKWMATLTKYWGEQKGQKYFEKLSQKKLIIRNGLTLVGQMVSSGEDPLSITVLNHAMEKSKKDGAPVDWVPLEPVVSTSAKIMLPKKSSHPNAGLLWIDFILSKEGQSIMASMNRIPVREDVPIDPPKLNNGFKYINVDSEEMINNGTKWMDAFNTLFVKKSK